ncbi:MAG: phosphoribosylglycinamide formyltransferase [Ignavibacteriales bacterium]|nr:phosphoribosylglycinamide formyltransferase [Ignavibacteriales bacterium]MCF8305176.1 phosphoribosylglycinamide formyltransferase [Ignavibacteriales bacterium]MCF8314911.1 phosphoribosylglycinamide formyltransferase [Ignavibacteriales bacterium]MCF8436140.1 phosphoribosylglycinamide formyltransferase [Ignavibacteriales bacterium]
MFKIVVFASGSGSNLRSLLNEFDKSKDIRVDFVISDKIHPGAFDVAAEYSVPVLNVAETGKPGFLTYDALASVFTEKNINLIVLAGFLKKIPDSFVRTFRSRIINIHPALLPGFGGAGMYGIRVHRAVFESGVKISGATIHFVDEYYDHGKIIAQAAVDIKDALSPEDIAGLVLKTEHKLLPETVRKIAAGKLKEIDNRIIIL